MSDHLRHQPGQGTPGCHLHTVGLRFYGTKNLPASLMPSRLGDWGTPAGAFIHKTDKLSHGLYRHRRGLYRKVNPADIM